MRTGHWMITSNAEGDDIHYVDAPAQQAEQFVGFSQRIDVIDINWGDIRPIIDLAVKKTKKKSEKLDHFTSQEDKDLFEL